MVIVAGRSIHGDEGRMPGGGVRYQWVDKPPSLLGCHRPRHDGTHTVSLVPVLHTSRWRGPYLTRPISYCE